MIIKDDKINVVLLWTRSDMPWIVDIDLTSDVVFCSDEGPLLLSSIKATSFQKDCMANQFGMVKISN